MGCCLSRPKDEKKKEDTCNGGDQEFENINLLKSHLHIQTDHIGGLFTVKDSESEGI